MADYRTRAMCGIFGVKCILGLVVLVLNPLANGQETSTTEVQDIYENSNFSGDLSYQVSLHYSYNGEFICGGSIIASKIVLTAAHCMFYKWGGLLPPLIVTVSAGKTNLNESTTSGTFDVANITLHPDFDETTMTNDLAVIEVNDAFPTNDLIGSVPLEKNVEPAVPYNSCVVSVWNQITYDLEVIEVVLSRCETLVDNICATKKDTNDTTCVTGPGSPLICDEKLVGVLSVDPDCNDTAQQTIFENVRNSISWLNKFNLSASSAQLPIFACSLLLLVAASLRL